MQVRSSNSFQMTAFTSIRGFMPEGSSYRFVVQVGAGALDCCRGWGLGLWIAAGGPHTLNH